MRGFPYLFFFFFNDTATTEIYTLSLHDALPIYEHRTGRNADEPVQLEPDFLESHGEQASRRRRSDRKSTRLNSSHGYISYAVFCLKKKKNLRPTNNLSTHSSRHEY